MCTPLADAAVAAHTLHAALPILQIDADALDLRRFERLVARARPLDAGPRAELLREALGLWRGAPLADQRPSASRKSSARGPRSEEHTSELQSQSNIVCRLWLEKQ